MARSPDVDFSPADQCTAPVTAAGTGGFADVEAFAAERAATLIAGTGSMHTETCENRSPVVSR